MVVHNVAMFEATEADDTLTATVSVTRPDQLAAALRQRSKPVVIENNDLERSFSRLEFWQGREGTLRYVATLVFALLALAMALRYGIDFNWQRDRKLDRLDGRITLTPPHKS